MKKSIIFLLLLIFLTACEEEYEPTYKLLDGTYQTQDTCVGLKRKTVIIYKDGIIETSNGGLYEEDVTFYNYKKSEDFDYNNLIYVENDSTSFSFQFDDEHTMYFPFFLDDGLISICKLDKCDNLPINSHRE